MTEDQLQLDVAKALDLLGWRWMHCPNEGKRSKASGGRLKGHGMKKGVPDVLIFEDWCDVSSHTSAPHICDYGGHGIAIELKVGGNRPTTEQVEWLAALKKRGWMTAVCRDIGDVMDVLRKVRPTNGRGVR